MQRTVKVNTLWLKKNFDLIVSCAEYEAFDIGLMLVSNREIQRLNQQYRGKDEVTDVLAFPYHEILPQNAGVVPKVHPQESTLGDIVLGMPYIASTCLKKAENLETSLVAIFTHGLCHLVGYNHETEIEWTQMHKKELQILQKYNKLLGSHCQPLLGVGHYE